MWRFLARGEAGFPEVLFHMAVWRGNYKACMSLGIGCVIQPVSLKASDPITVHSSPWTPPGPTYRVEADVNGC